MTTVERVLEILENNRNSDVSGQEIAQRLGVSRNAVWKAINALRDEGYDILSSTRRGYRISPDCDIISVTGIRSKMNSDIPITVYKTTDSTNAQAKAAIAKGGLSRALFVAEEQTAGRGRMGRSFYSPYGSGIYMSYVFSPGCEVTSAVSVTAAAAVAVLRALDQVCTVRGMIKWVNDIYVNDKKVCGILTEAITNYETGVAEHVIIGVGINVKTHRFPRELRDIAASIDKKGFTRNELIAAISDNLYAMSDNLADKSFFDFYRERMLVLGKDITYTENGITHAAHAIDIDAAGGLVVTDIAGGERILRSGEISVRLCGVNDEKNV